MRDPSANYENVMQELQKKQSQDAKTPPQADPVQARTPLSAPPAVPVPQEKAPAEAKEAQTPDKKKGGALSLLE